MKIVILCGGEGTRLQEATGGLIPKPMVVVAGRPILWHIMKGFAQYGQQEFVLCLGHLGHLIKHYFLNYEAMNRDVTLRLGGTQGQNLHDDHDESGWLVTLADTGERCMTGGRVARIRRYVNDDPFILTYGDGVSDIDINALLAFHKAHGRIATVTGVRPQGRFGHLVVNGDAVESFNEKPKSGLGSINGGFFVLQPEIFEYVTADDQCIFERGPLERLARDGQLMMFQHDGFWRCVDTKRDLDELQNLAADNVAPWQTWLQ